MKNLILGSFVLLFFLGCTTIKEKPITELKEEELENVVLVDVRTPKEFNEGHLENALNIDWMGENFIEEFEKGIDKNKTIYLYCRSGRRSADATKYLDSLGYKDVYNLTGGYIAWVEKNAN